MSTYIGIDPGKGGGIGIIKRFDGMGCRNEDIGKLEFASLSLKTATERDAWDFLGLWVHGMRCHGIIERVSASPQMGVVSAFTFGKFYGFLRGILIASHVSFEEVTPKKWQTAMGCLSGGNKNVTKAKAQQLFPDVKVTHGIADALLLAEYCRRISTRELVTP